MPIIPRGGILPILPSRPSWTPLPSQIPWRSPGFLPRVAGVELGLADEIMRAVPSPDLLRPRSGEDVHFELGIQFLSSAGCNYLFGVHDPCGVHNTWLSLFSLGLSSFEMATLKTFRHAASRIGPVTSRLLIRYGQVGVMNQQNLYLNSSYFHSKTTAVLWL